MMPLKENKKVIALVVLLLIVIYLMITALSSVETRVGKTDYLGYWSASYLLAQRENFTDDLLLLRTQREITNTDREWPIKSWNPPWLLVWLLPFTLLAFDQAATVWLVTNFFLVFASAVLIWRQYVPVTVARHWFWLPILAAVLYPFTLTALVVGQVDLLVLFGLAAFLSLFQAKRDFSAGLVLSLTMVKPHLVYLTLPLILIRALKYRRWQIPLGFLTSLLVSTLVVAFMRPTFLAEYAASVSGGGLLNYHSPTLPVVLSLLFENQWIRLIGLLILPATIWFWLTGEGEPSLGSMVDMSLLASIITAPFLWSYDFVVLLIPLIRVWIWMIDGVLSRLETIGLAIVMVTLYIFLYDKRIDTPSEIYYAWFPVLVAMLYWLCWFRQDRRAQRPATT